MLNKLLEEIVVSIVGKSAEGIVGLLNTPKYVNEFVIAKKLGITINQTRNILYKISDYGLVSSIRKKDKKKGWYTYFWKFEILKCLEFLKDFLMKNKMQIQEEINLRKSKVFYVCESCGLEYGEDEALLMNFTCDECGEIFTVKDSSKLIKDFERSLLKIDDKSKLVEAEMENERTKLDKKKEAEGRKEEKENKKRKEAEKKKRADKKKLSKAVKIKPNQMKKKPAVKKEKKKKFSKKKTKKKSQVKKKSLKKKPSSKKQGKKSKRK